MADSKYIERIRAMLRKAGENNPSEEERDTALRMAHKLMMKHGLTEEDIGDPNKTDGRGFDQQPYFRTQTEAEKWKGTLLCNIAEFYFCDAYAMIPRWATSEDVAEWYVMGRQDHIEVFKMMFEFICPQLEAAFNKALNDFGNIQERHARTYCVETCREMRMDTEIIESMMEADLGKLGILRLEAKGLHGGDAEVEDIMELCEIESFNYAKKVRAYIKRGEIGRGRPDSRLDVWRNSFYIGAITELRERLEDMTREDIEELGKKSEALVVLEREALVRWQKEIGHEVHQKRSARTLDREGVGAGMRAGGDIDLMPGKKLGMERRELDAGR